MHAASDRSGIFHAQLLVFDALHAGMREPIDGQGVFMLLNPRGAHCAESIPFTEIVHGHHGSSYPADRRAHRWSHDPVDAAIAELHRRDLFDLYRAGGARRLQAAQNRLNSDTAVTYSGTSGLLAPRP